jgi:hypothetical protein
MQTSQAPLQCLLLAVTWEVFGIVSERHVIIKSCQAETHAQRIIK